jgi:hypothetical protein
MSAIKNIKILKLLGGEQIIANVISESDSEIIIDNPVRILVMPSAAGPKNPNVGLAPWAEFSDDKQFRIHKAHVVITMSPIVEFINQYNSIFGGIVVPPSKIILPGTE